MRNKHILPLVFVIPVFILLPMVYFSPLLEGKKVLQPDIVHFVGGAKEITDFRSTTGKESYWVNSMFSGMPTYQFGARYSYDFIRYLDSAINFLPHPANYIFVMLIGFFILLRILSMDWKTALLGAVFVAFSTYFFILIAVGHNAKIHALSYFPGTIAGILLIYRKRYLTGTLLTTLFMALQIHANHLQMTYYMGLMLIIFGLVELIYALKNKVFTDFITASILCAFSLFVGIGMNANRIIPTYEYSQYSTRGPSELTLQKTTDDTTSGMKKSEITAWSYGIGETLNLFLPNLYGGSSSHTIDYNGQPIASAYWGAQPFTSGPVYVGAVVVFLFFLGLFVVKNRYKWWLLIATLLSILLAWGHNFSFLTNFMIDYFLLYSKFRAITSVLVIAEFCMPILAAMTVYEFTKNPSKEKIKKLFLTAVLFGVFLMFIAFFAEDLFPLLSPQEIKSVLPSDLLSFIKGERLSAIRMDIAKAFIYLSITAGALFLLQKKINFPAKRTILVLIILFVGLFDLWHTNKDYLNDRNFVDAYYVKHPYPTRITKKIYDDVQKNPALASITGQQMEKVQLNKSLENSKKRDTSYYRVFNIFLSPMSETNTSYFHHSIGGYHAAKIRRYQDLYNRYISKGDKNVLNMLNSKYIISQNPKATILDSLVSVQENPNVNGNAWFVKEIKTAKNPDEELEDLGKINTKIKAIINAKDALYVKKKKYNIGTHDAIKLTRYTSNHLVYSSESKSKQFAVFSDIEYPGWQAYIDKKKTKHFRVNYLLRGLQIPKGKHLIEFKFEPAIVKIGKWVSAAFYLIFLLLLIAIFRADKRKKI